jgi:MarR family 2-MHQ and catechol resistance regulon transcriptional repressor
MSLNKQAERLYEAFSELVRRYQFRDRDQICCHGLSVSQCYTLDALAEEDSLTMGELTAKLCLKISSATRVVDPMVERGWVRRIDDPNDRRICRVQATAKGRQLMAKVKSDLVHEHEHVLRNVPPESREAVIQAMIDLLAAVEKRSCCEKEACCA